MHITDLYHKPYANSDFMVCFSPLCPQMCFGSKDNEYQTGCQCSEKRGIYTHNHDHAYKHTQCTYKLVNASSLQIQLCS